ncbi:hypothetical protein [Silvanigrella aquatica]|uniref:Uncharacterized protein n=1 Tax=Silvanigrella aquatica TaxID=1915309 RepID=A0A1L4CYB3_9BACT|nr:hypothetical protein [Silvanigrella aquatica]APJ02936.1 hypothetical protein AXG55_03000 [Silvanigrella aquatica]
MKNHIKKFISLIFIIIFIPLYSSCGSQNLFSSLTPETTKQQAEDDINSGNYASSISLLAPYVASNPGDAEAIGMLTTSYMLLSGINLLNIMVSIQSATGSSKNNFQAILKAMPAGNATNVSLLTKAVSTISLISVSSMNTSQSYLYAVASASLAILIIKQDCLDSSGNISTSLTNAISTTDANSIYSNLTNAQTGYTNAGVTSSSSSGSGILANLINQINSTTGASNAAKVANYIISQE